MAGEGWGCFARICWTRPFRREVHKKWQFLSVKWLFVAMVIEQKIDRGAATRPQAVMDSASSGLAVPPAATLSTWVSIMVVETSEWPSNSCTVRMSAADKKSHPIQVNLFGAQAIVFVAQSPPQRIGQAGRLGTWETGLLDIANAVTASSKNSPNEGCKWRCTTFRCFDRVRSCSLLLCLTSECQDWRSATSR